MLDKIKKYQKPLIVAFPIIILIIISTIIFIPIINRKTNESPKNLESTMQKLVQEYYENNVKGKVFGINRYMVTLETMKEKGMNVDKLINDDNGCSNESYSYVLIENPNETDKDKIKYTVENHLKCKNYES